MPRSVAAALLAQLHDRADVLARREDRGAHDRLADLGDLAAGELATGWSPTSSLPSSIVTS